MDDIYYNDFESDNDYGMDKEWLNEEITIKRKEFSKIIATEIAEIMDAVDAVFGDEEGKDVIKELLMTFSASVATRLFDKEE